MTECYYRKLHINVASLKRRGCQAYHCNNRENHGLKAHLVFITQYNAPYPILNQPEVGVHVLGVLGTELRILIVLLVDVKHTSRQNPDQ